MLKVTSRYDHHPNTIKVEWNLGKRCNYDCGYCPKEIHDNSSEHTDIEILKGVVDKLVMLGKPIRLSFTGGEPCVHPKFTDLILYARHKGISWTSVTTNGTLPKEFYKLLPVDQFVFSLHFEYNWRRVLTTITYIHENRVNNYLVNVMAHHDHMTDVKNTVGYFKEYGMPYAVRRIRWTEGDHNIFDDMRYHPDDFKWIMEQEATVSPNVIIWLDDQYAQIHKHANDVIKHHQNKFKGWYCNAGIESLMINWDGDVHRATCRVGGSLGNIYDGSFVVPNDPIICTRDFCTCAADIPLTKVSVQVPETLPQSQSGAVHPS